MNERPFMDDINLVDFSVKSRSLTLSIVFIILLLWFDWRKRLGTKYALEIT